MLTKGSQVLCRAVMPGKKPPEAAGGSTDQRRAGLQAASWGKGDIIDFQETSPALGRLTQLLIIPFRGTPGQVFDGKVFANSDDRPFGTKTFFSRQIAKVGFAGSAGNPGTNAAFLSVTSACSTSCNPLMAATSLFT